MQVTPHLLPHSEGAAKQVSDMLPNLYNLYADVITIDSMRNIFIIGDFRAYFYACHIHGTDTIQFLFSLWEASIGCKQIS